jgi:hypothetical protein
MKKFAVIKTTGEIDFQEVSEEGEYDFLSGAVGGWIQSVPLVNDFDELNLWCNEEGKLNGLPLNALATELGENSYGKTDMIVGNAVITGGADDEGETMGLTQEQMDKLAQFFVMV